MDYIRVTKENIDREHICCAMSGKQSLAKKEWLKQRFEEGLVFYRSAERGKCFIEYIPAENAWVPIDAAGWLYINCLWVSGALKGHGTSSMFSPCRALVSISGTGLDRLSFENTSQMQKRVRSSLARITRVNEDRTLSS